MSEIDYIHRYDGNDKTLCGLNYLFGSTNLPYKVTCPECRFKQYNNPESVGEKK